MPMSGETAEEAKTRYTCTICHAFNNHLAAMVELNEAYPLSNDAYFDASRPIHRAQQAHEADAHPAYAARIAAMVQEQMATKEQQS